MSYVTMVRYVLRNMYIKKYTFKVHYNDTKLVKLIATIPFDKARFLKSSTRKENTSSDDLGPIIIVVDISFRSIHRALLRFMKSSSISLYNDK